MIPALRRGRAAALAALAIGLACPAFGQSTQARQPLTHELLWSFKRVGAPVPSPDGRWVLVSVTEPSYEPDADVSDLWIVSADGSAAPRRLTNTRTGEGDVAWSADSRRIAFSARRDGDDVSQIYVLDVTGGEARRATEAPTAASRPRWSPDGTRLLFEADMWPGAVDEKTNRDIVERRKQETTSVRVYETFPIRDWDRWRDPSRPHVWVIDPAAGRTARSLLAGSQLAAGAGFGPTDLSAVWAPDGQSVVFVATDHADRAARAPVTTALYQVGVDGGEPVRLTDPAWDASAPVFRPDGRALCFGAQPAEESLYHLTRLACGAWPWSEAGTVAVLAPEFDRALASWAFTPDSRTVFFTAADSGHEQIFAVPATGGAVTRVLPVTQGSYSSLAIPSQAGTPALFLSWESAVSPAEVVRLDAASGESAFLTSFNTDLAKAIDWQPLRDFWFETPDGRRLHSFVALPPNFDESQRYPLLVLIHGGHASMWRDGISYRWNAHLLAQPGFVVLMTDYRGSTGYGEAFTRSIWGDPLAGPADDVNLAADEAIRRFPFVDGARQAAGGASYGGHLVNWLAGTTDRYRALVSHAGLATLEQQWGTSDSIRHREVMMRGPYWEDVGRWVAQSPLAKAGAFRTPLLLSIGVNDYRVPLNNTLTMYAALQRQNIPSRLLVWTDENHWILKGANSRRFYTEVSEWLARHLR